MNHKKEGKKQTSFLGNLLGTLFFIGAILFIVYLVLPKETQEQVKRTIQTEFSKKDENKILRERWKKSNENYKKPTQKSTQSQPKKIKEHCYKCKGSGTCRICNGQGYFFCPTHDTDGDGYCTSCNNQPRFRCDCSAGKCEYCNGRGYTIAYQ